MVRIKRGNVARKRRKKVLALAKGFRGAHSRLFRVALFPHGKALKYSYQVNDITREPIIAPFTFSILKTEGGNNGFPSDVIDLIGIF
jgi:hypothetical protein